jgi:hypothetical protein
LPHFPQELKTALQVAAPQHEAAIPHIYECEYRDRRYVHGEYTYRAHTGEGEQRDRQQCAHGVAMFVAVVFAEKMEALMAAVTTPSLAAGLGSPMQAAAYLRVPVWPHQLSTRQNVEKTRVLISHPHSMHCDGLPVLSCILRPLLLL